jgi:hypothetical protein
MNSLACGRPGDSALLLACMFGVLLLFQKESCAYTSTTCYGNSTENSASDLLFELACPGLDAPCFVLLQAVVRCCSRNSERQVVFCQSTL